MDTSFLILHSSIRLTVERNINLRAHLVLLAYSIGVCQLRNWMWVCCRDIEPGELVKVPKERAFFNVVKTNGPRYRSTYVCDLVEKRRNMQPVGRASSKSTLRGNRATFSFFTRSSGLPLDVWHFDCRGSPSERSEMPITGIALRGVSGQRTFVTATVRHYRNCRRAICLKFGCRVLRDSH